MKKYAIGIDLGGTSVKYALIDNEGVFHFQGKLPSKADVSGSGNRRLVTACKASKRPCSSPQVAVERNKCTRHSRHCGRNQHIVLGGAENIIRLQENLNLHRVTSLRSRQAARADGATACQPDGTGRNDVRAGQAHRMWYFLTRGNRHQRRSGHRWQAVQRLCQRRRLGRSCPSSPTGEPAHAALWAVWRHYASTSALVRRFPVACRELGIVSGEEINGELIVRLYKEGDKLATECLDEHCDFHRDTASPDSSTSSARNAS